MKTILALVAGLLFSAPAWGQSLNTFTNCATPASAATTKTTGLSVGTGAFLCFDFDENFGTSSSPGFNVNSPNANVCLNDDRNTSVAASATVTVQACPGPDPVSDNACFNTSVVLSSSNCGMISRGRYRLDVNNAASAGDDAQVVIQGY
jgi:hypothetical protein